MIVDERIRTVRNRAAAGGYFITYILLLTDLLYRQFYLKQPLGDYWDIFLIWFASSLYTGITMYSSGMMSGRVGKQFKIIIPVVIVTIIVMSLIRGDITTIHDFSGFIVGLVVMIAVLFSVYLFYNCLNRRWEKKSGLEE